jgi:hypothetical protein
MYGKRKNTEDLKTADQKVRTLSQGEIHFVDSKVA